MDAYLHFLTVIVPLFPEAFLMEHVVSTIIEVHFPSFHHIIVDALQQRFASSLRLSLSSLRRPLPLSHH